MNIGDWVGARTISGHVVKGYIEAADYSDEAEGTAYLIRVFSSCCKTVHMVEMAYADQCRIDPPDAIYAVEGYLRNMIDLALDTWDQEEFNRLSQILRKVQAGKHHDAIYGGLRWVTIKTTLLAD